MKRVTTRSFVVSSLALLLIVQSASSEPAGPYTAEIETFERFVESQMEIDRIPGLSVGFMKDDFLWAKGFGFADLENRTPATERSSYRLASNSKSMTAVAILQLVEQGKIDLDAEIQEYVPYFPRKRLPITVRQLLGHLGGISHYKDYELEGHIKEHKYPRDSLAIFADFDLVAEPGTEFEYSSYGYNLLGAVVEGAAKQPFGQYLREHLWGPLEMDDTYMDDPDRVIPNRVQGYRIVDGELKNSEFVDISSRFAAGGTRSTVVDLLKYAKGLGSERVLSPKSVNLMHTSLTTADGHFTDYGLGWKVSPVDGRFCVYHTGGQPETRTLLVRFPREDFAIAVAYNLEGGNLHAYARRLVQLILHEAWNVPAYTGDRVDEALFKALQDAFNYGFTHFDRYCEPRSTDQGELAEAFAYLNACLSRSALESDYDVALKKITDGRHPTAKEAFVKVGSYVALKLQEEVGSDQLDMYHKMGAIPFFHDYIASYRRDPNYPDAFRFSGKLEELLTAWNRDWQKTWNEYTRYMVIAPFADIRVIGGRLKKLFAGAKVYPDFRESFVQLVRHHYVKGNEREALAAARLYLDLYPGSPAAHVMMANTHTCFGNRNEALTSLRRAFELNPEDPAVTTKALARYAAELIDNGRLNEAMTLLETTVEFVSEKATLYDHMAAIHIKKARALYMKALDADPVSEHAWKMLKRLPSEVIPTP